MITKSIKIASNYDGLGIDMLIMLPEQEVKGVVQIAHGMAEYKERYMNFMSYLADKGFASVIHDHRGHGESILNEEDLGYFYSENTNAIVEDLHQVTNYIQNVILAYCDDVPIYLFSHSMGTLVARNYIKKYDGEIDKLVLCGPPTKNNAAFFGLMLTYISKLLHGAKHRDHFIQKISVGSFNKNYSVENEWICKNKTTVAQYNNDSLCGFVFTNNGFINLFKLQLKAFSKRKWELHNPDMPILLIAGEDDPVIQKKEKMVALKDFLNDIGYRNVEFRLFKGKRHEILNEENNMEIFEYICSFLS